MEQVAERVSEVLQDEFEDVCLVGVSYYDEDGVGHVYRSEWAAEKYDPEEVDQIVEDLRLEAIGHGAHEQRQNERLHATVRLYDEMLDIAVPITELRGVAVALDKEGEYSIRDVVAAIERCIEEADVE